MSRGRVVSVTGELSPGELGITLTHEHLFLQLENWFVRPTSPEEERLAYLPVSLETLPGIRYRPYSNWDNIHIDHYPTVLNEVLAFKNAGGGTIVDTSPHAIGRDPVRMKRLAQEAGINVVAGSSYYVQTSHPPSVASTRAEQLADEIEQELLEGVGDTGIRPGVIGEVGTSSPITPDEEKVLRASAMAQRRTGAPMTIHLSAVGKEAGAVLDILESSGALLDKVVLGHLDDHPINTHAHASFAARGAYIEYDLFGLTEFSEDGYWLPPPSDTTRIEAIKALLEAGHGDRIVISHDVCTKFQQLAYGGFGFSHIPGHVIPLMRTMGLGEKDIDRIVRRNPAEWLTWT